MRGQKFGKPFDRKRPRDKIALGVVERRRPTAQLGQALRRLDAFDHHCPPRGPDHLDGVDEHARRQAAVRRQGESPVELDPIDGECRKVGHVGIAGAEIVDIDVDAGAPGQAEPDASQLS